MPQYSRATLAFAQHDHADCQTQALARAEAALAGAGGRMTPTRRRVLEILLETHRAMGAYEILERLAQEGYASQPPVAYRALEFWVTHGAVHRIERLNAFAACTGPADAHMPMFLICKECGAVAEMAPTSLPQTLGAVAGDAGFAVECATLELLGLCAICERTKQQAEL